MVLVDTSIWIEYFRGNPDTAKLHGLIDSNNLCVNDLILAQNARDHGMAIYARDGHFALMSGIHGLSLFA